jgi:putative cell wall-binding protein
LISVFDSRWASAISIGILNAETANEGISPSKYVINVDGQQNDLIYGEPTSELITRPYFLLTSDESEASVLYSDEEKTALQTTYEKQDISDSIKEKVSSMSSTILAKMNLNIEQNLSFQKTKTKALKFKNTSIFEEAPEVNESPATTSTTLSTTSGNY